jgi:hypothetical protein
MAHNGLTEPESNLFMGEDVLRLQTLLAEARQGGA